MPRRLAALIAILLLSACDDSGARSNGLPPVDPGTPPAPTKEQTLDAERLMAELDHEVAVMRTLPVEGQKAKELAFGKRLEAALSTTIGTKYENKNLYWLAFWRLTYPMGDGADVDQLLDRLERLPSPSWKASGASLRVQLRLHQGRIREARALAEPLVTRIKEFSWLLDQVVFHESIGQPAPRIAGHNLNGGTQDPLTLPVPWEVYLFVEQFNDSAAFLAGSYRSVMASLTPPSQARLVVVTFEGSALEPVARLRQLTPPDNLPDLLWANPNQGGDAEAWRTRWKLPPSLPHACLIGPDRSIMAVDITPEELGRQLGAGGRPAGGAARPLSAPAP
jgi:hypothetical protein